MKKQQLIQLPELPSRLTPERFVDVEIDDPYLYQTIYEKETLPIELTDRLDVNQVCFRNVSFAGLVFERATFENVRFEQCDLTGCQFQDSRFHRVVFEDCRLTGIQFETNTIDHVTIKGCQANYAQIIRTALRHVLIEQTAMRESHFFEMKPIDLRFDEVDLTESQWVETALQGLDLRHADLSGLTIDPRFLPGAIVTESQAITFARLLGLVIPSHD
ncbi:pentapeptide repeat-containing protein [Exiguobacterium artemiae]